MSRTRIVIIGATGHFGGRICRRILGEPNTEARHHEPQISAR